jgi:hypothetical protein
MKYQNDQKYSECVMVSAINAAVHLGLPPVELESVEYERLVNLAGARHGSVIHPKLVYRYLGIDRVPIEPDWGIVTSKLRMGSPVEFLVWHLRCGRHSVLATAYKGRSLKVWNLRKLTKRGWIEWPKFKRLVNAARSNNLQRSAWAFGLDSLHVRGPVIPVR